MTKTMSHTPAQRKAWHEGKQRPREDKYEMFRRVFVSAKNFKGAATPPQLKKFLRYAPGARRIK
jgi:hypothetical protein